MLTTFELYRKALYVFNQQPVKKVVVKLSISCYDLITSKKSQISLFDFPEDKQRKVSVALDAINDKYGEYVITPGLMLGMKDLVIDRIAFGGVKELEDLYEN